MSNELFSTGGYNLEYFQLYNWGTFDKKIYTVTANNKSTLLTGENGSGKTTLVDALLTLLVPNDKRFYNQSSGEAKKRDRSEDSYVLGAYGTKMSGDDKDSSAQYLRKRESTISILNGCFTHPFTAKSITLLQVRYFTNSDLQKVFAMTEGKLSIEEINEVLAHKQSEILRDKKWKDILTTAKGTVFYLNFKHYVSAFSRVFGFRSDKALTLFSQIVGLKVLGDINTFIKYNMLEEGNILSEFEKLQDNYTNLVHSYREIQKTKVQIDKFKLVYDRGIQYKSDLEKQKNVIEMMESIPYWHMIYEEGFLLEKQNICTEKQRQIKSELQRTKIEIQGLDDSIESLNHSIAQDSNKIRLIEIENRMEKLQEEKKLRQQKHNQLSVLLKKLNIPFPSTKEKFFDCVKQSKKIYEDAVHAENDFEEHIRQIKNQQDVTVLKLRELKDELASLKNRDNNIPEPNIQMRKRICSALRIPEEQIPFAGELISVKEDEKAWNNVIERVLHNFALTLIVPASQYKKVSSFVNSNNMQGRVVYLKAEEDFLMEKNHETSFEEKKLGTKLAFKENALHALWVKEYVRQRFDYLCAENIDEYVQAKKAITKEGLVKSHLRNEKDDRPGKNSESSWVLGWNNKEKRQLLSKEYEVLTQNLSDLGVAEEKLFQQKNLERHTQNICHEISLFLDWHEIDVESVIKELDGVQREKVSVLASNSSLAELEKQLAEKKELKTQKNDFMDSLNKTFGKIEQELTNTANKLEQNTQILSSLKKEISKDLLDSRLQALEKKFHLLATPKNLQELEDNRWAIDKKLKEDEANYEKIISDHVAHLGRLMGNALHPSGSIKDKYGDWGIEFPNLNTSIEYLDDFIAVYNRLKNDDLPKYTTRFHNYLNTSLKEDFNGFQRSIQDQQQEIKRAISSLNQDLKKIVYNKNPDTYLQLDWRTKSDTDIRTFRNMLQEAKPDAMLLVERNLQKEEEQFEKIQRLLKKLQEDERFRKKVLDIRNWFQYGAEELSYVDNSQKQYYSDSSSLSGGQKTKLTYTILASAISYQFGITANMESNSSFRFVIIDEAFSKIDAKNSEQVMAIFNDLDIQVMVVTPNDKINVVEEYISSIHLVDKSNTDDSRLLYLGIQEYKEKTK